MYRILATRRALSRALSTTTAAAADATADVTVIGGGAVGLAIGAHLARSAQRSGRSTDGGIVVLEKEPHAGLHSSSRNSEVIHAGLYYPRGSLKTRLCLRGKELMYAFARAHGVPHTRCGKWVVATQDGEPRLRAIAEHAKEHGVPVAWLPVDEARQAQPNLARRVTRVLESPSTGIVAACKYMDAVAGVFEEAGGQLALRSRVEAIKWDPAAERYLLRVVDGAEAWTLATRAVVNAAGVWSDHIQRLGFTAVHGADALSAAPPADAHWTHPSLLAMHPTRGHYFRLRRNNSVHRVSRLIYPIPDPNVTSLGIHATVDLAGDAKFGPSVEWLPRDAREHYAPLAEAAESHLRGEFARAVAEYLDGVPEDDLAYDYCGIRAKVSGPGVPARDFWVARADGGDGAGAGMPNWVNCIGIESPGLTSSLAIAEYVGNELLGYELPNSIV
ncbi:hypothetical protein H9P43_002511 [Blastocladiella emersonii ATCC 22665]|nr:hypothetical protein H9P43_002511 [Blastocladiella emersonii ATCC 22665]